MSTRNPAPSLILLRHRVDGTTLNFDREAFERGELANSGYNPDDWLTSDQYLALESEEEEEEETEAEKKAAAAKAAAAKAPAGKK